MEMTSAQSQMTGYNNDISWRCPSAILDSGLQGQWLGIAGEVGGEAGLITMFPLARLLVEMKQSWLWGLGSIFFVLLGIFCALLDWLTDFTVKASIFWEVG